MEVLRMNGGQPVRADLQKQSTAGIRSWQIFDWRQLSWRQPIDRPLLFKRGGEFQQRILESIDPAATTTTHCHHEHSTREAMQTSKVYDSEIRRSFPLLAVYSYAY